MDELNFRRRIYADPNDNSPEVVAACQQDKHKANFKTEMEQFDELLGKSLDIELPDKLADKILLGQSLDYQQKQKKKHRLHLAIAASIAFTVGISFQMLNNSGPKYIGAGDHALAHLQSELTHIPETANYSHAQLNAKLAYFGGEMENIAPIKFANFCDFDGIRSLHLVLQDNDANVTIFVVPQDSGLNSNAFFQNAQYQGHSIEHKNAKLLIVTDHKTSLQNWSKKVDKAIKWEKA